MWIKKILGAMMITILASGCGAPDEASLETHFVTRREFDDYRDRIKEDGDTVEAWVAAAHEWIVFLNDNIDVWCPDCTPPDLPPPPPDGDWQ